MPAKSTSVSAVAKAIFPKLGLSSKSANAGVFSGTWGGAPVSGAGYVELTGYGEQSGAYQR